MILVEKNRHLVSGKFAIRIWSETDHLFLEEEDIVSLYDDVISIMKMIGERDATEDMK